MAVEASRCGGALKSDRSSPVKHNRLLESQYSVKSSRCKPPEPLRNPRHESRKNTDKNQDKLFNQRGYLQRVS